METIKNILKGKLAIGALYIAYAFGVNHGKVMQIKENKQEINLEIKTEYLESIINTKQDNTYHLSNIQNRLKQNNQNTNQTYLVNFTQDKLKIYELELDSLIQEKKKETMQNRIRNYFK